MVVGDATSLTQAGYVGEDVDSLLKRLLDAANGDATGPMGHLYIDEIDKLARRGWAAPPCATSPARAYNRHY